MRRPGYHKNSYLGVGKAAYILAAQITKPAEQNKHCCQRTKMDLEDAPQEDPDAGLSVGTVHAAFILSAAVAVALTFGKDLIKGKLSMNSDVGGQTPQFKAFQRTYLTVYLLMMAGDWLQGPYMYALYDAYGFKHEEIAALFVAGFFFPRGRQISISYVWSSLRRESVAAMACGWGAPR